LLFGGSRSGKSFILVYALFVRALKSKSRHVIFRHRFNHAKSSLWYDTIMKVRDLEVFKKIPIVENKTDWFLEFPNGSTIWLAGLDDKDRTEKILGNEYSTIFFNEISQIGYNEVMMGITRLSENSGLPLKAYYDCNPPSPKHWAYKLFVQNVHPVSNQIVKKDNYLCMRMNPDDNRENIADGYISELENLPERHRRRFLLGEWVDDVEGALWTSAIIDRNRVNELPEMRRIVIAVDPAVTSNEDSDETGIIVCGKGYDDEYYVWEDHTGKFTPRQWAERVVFNYHKNKADAIIGEVNNGGDLVEANIRTVDQNVKYIAVHASRGKAIRAEPVSGLYEQNKVHHVGSLPKLEEEQITWNVKSDKSPNRIDALVWGITELMGGAKKNTNYWA
jgi:PBSX family phage terminase large subunit